MKERLINSFGILGGIFFYSLSAFVFVFPLVMINASFWLNLLLLSIMFFFRPSSLIFWVWGLICAFKGPQDAWAIIYYILFALFFIPFFFDILRSFSRK